MKNLDPKRREELYEAMEESRALCSLSYAELRTLLAASEMVDAAEAEIAATRRTYPDHDASFNMRDARANYNTLAARLGWEQEGR